MGIRHQLKEVSVSVTTNSPTGAPRTHSGLGQRNPLSHDSTAQAKDADRVHSEGVQS